MANAKRIKTEHGAVFLRASSAAANPGSDGEPEVRLYKKTLKSWTPVITEWPHQAIESRNVAFVTTEHLHRAMGTSDEDRRLLS